MVASFREIIGFWGSHVEMAADVGAKPDTVRKWAERDRIPSEYWARTIEVARSLGRDVTAEDMTRLAAKPIHLERAETAA